LRDQIMTVSGVVGAALLGKNFFDTAEEGALDGQGRKHEINR